MRLKRLELSSMQETFKDSQEVDRSIFSKAGELALLPFRKALGSLADTVIALEQETSYQQRQIDRQQAQPAEQ